MRGDPSVRRSFLDDLATQLPPIHASVRPAILAARQRAALAKAAQARSAAASPPDPTTLEVDQQPAALVRAHHGHASEAGARKRTKTPRLVVSGRRMDHKHPN